MKRIQLTWSRSQDDKTKSYRVFRATTPNVTRKELLVMEVAHNIVPAPISVQGEVLKKKENNSYEAKYKNIMPDQDHYPVQLFLNGTDVTQLGIHYGVDYENGMFIFGTAFNDSDEVVASYYIDGVRVLDTDEIEQEEVKYFGPTARDRTEAPIPENVTLFPDHPNGRVILSWPDSSTTGQPFHYRVEAIDEYGNFSMLSHEESIFLKEGLDNKGYLVERSFDNVSWHNIARQAENEYIEYGIDQEPPAPATNLQESVELNYSERTGDVTLSWDAALGGTPSASPFYRVRTISALGTLSRPSAVVGPVYLTSEVTHYIIRRKVFDGTYPTFDGNDATTVGQSETLLFTDANVPDNTAYGYSIYSIDAAGNHSIAATIKAEIGDATPPSPIEATTITVASYSYMI